MSGRGSASPGAAKLEPPTLEATYNQEWLDYLAHFQSQTGPTPTANSPAKPVAMPTASELKAGGIKALQAWLKASDLPVPPAQGAPPPLELGSTPEPVSAAQGRPVEIEKGGLPTQPVASGSGGYYTMLADNTSVNSSDPAGVNYIASHLFGYAPTAHQYAKALAAPPGSFIAVEPAIAQATTEQGQSSAGLSFFAISPETTEVYEATLLVGSDGSVLLKDETNSLYWPAPLSLSLAEAGVNFNAVTNTTTAPPSTATTSSPLPVTPWPPIPSQSEESKFGSVVSGVSSPDSAGHSAGTANTNGSTASKIQLKTYQGALELSHPQQQPSANQEDFEKPLAPYSGSGEGKSQQIQLADGTVVKTEHYSQLYYWNQAAKPFSTLSQEKMLHFTAQNYAELVSAPPGSQVSVTTSYNQYQPEEKPVTSTQQMIETSLIIEASHPLYGQATLTIGMPDWVGDPLTLNYQSDWGWPGLPYAHAASPPPPSASYPGYGEWGTKDYEAHQWAKHHFKQWKEQLTPQESRACVQYTQEWDYKQINGYLRGETTSYDGVPLDQDLAQQCIPQLDSAFEKAPALTENLVVYRGERFGFAQRFYQAYDNGLLAAAKTERTPLTYRNFLSTTLAQAGFGYEHFASDGDSSSVRLIIKVPKEVEARSAYLSTVSYESERELLFERGSQLYIDAFHKTTGGQLVVECSYAPPRQDGTGKLSALEYQQHCAAKAGLELDQYRQLKEAKRQAKIEALALAHLTGGSSKAKAKTAKTGATSSKIKAKTIEPKSKVKGQGTN